MPEQMLLRAQQLSFRYGPKLPWVLKGVDIGLARGERVGLFAPSGYGKTTLVKLLAGYLKPKEGSILWEGAEPPKKGKAPVQLVYQHPELAVNPRWPMQRVLHEAGQPEQDLLDELGIEPDWFLRLPRELSGGELQRFCLARALTARPRVLIADEMTTMLDVLTQAQLWEVVLKRVAGQDMGLLVVSHNRHLLERVCTRIEDLRELNRLDLSEL